MLSNEEVLEFEIDLTGSCNCHCERCSRNYIHSQHLVCKNIRPLPEITAQLDEFPNLKICNLAGQVSEPTMYKDLIPFLRYLKDRKIQVKLYTNGSLKRPDIFKAIGEVLDDEDQVIFTICGTTQELHETYRQFSKLSVIFKNAEALRNVRKIDYLQYIRFSYNMQDWESEKWKELGFTHSFWVESEGPRLGKSVGYRTIKTFPVKQKLYEILFKKVLARKYVSNDEFVCSHCTNGKIYISQFGVIYPCYMIAEYDRIPLKEFDYDFCSKKACVLCTKYSRKYMQEFGLDFLC